MPQALAAYNAGPQAVKDAVMRAAAHPGGDWLTFMPNETQAYVAKVAQGYASGNGAPALPTFVTSIASASNFNVS